MGSESWEPESSKFSQFPSLHIPTQPPMLCYVRAPWRSRLSSLPQLKVQQASLYGIKTIIYLYSKISNSHLHASHFLSGAHTTSRAIIPKNVQLSSSRHTSSQGINRIDELFCGLNYTFLRNDFFNFFLATEGATGRLVTDCEYISRVVSCT